MSDNPADSLRRELETAAKATVLATQHERHDPKEQDMVDLWATELGEYVVEDLLPLISAALEAARADERERLQQENQELRAALKEANQANERLLMALDSGGV